MHIRVFNLRDLRRPSERAATGPAQAQQNAPELFTFGGPAGGTTQGFNFNPFGSGTGTGGNPFANVNPMPSQPSTNDSFGGLKGNIFNIPSSTHTQTPPPQQPSSSFSGGIGGGSNNFTGGNSLFGSTVKQPATENKPEARSIFGSFTGFGGATTAGTGGRDGGGTAGPSASPAPSTLAAGGGPPASTGEDKPAPSGSSTIAGANFGVGANKGDNVAAEDAVEWLPQVDLAHSHAGEENEDVVMETRAKAHKYESNQGEKRWTGQGVGIVRILKDRATSRARIVLRADSSGKIVLKTALHKAIEYKANGNQVQFLLPKADGSPEMWALRVRKEDVNRLAASMESCKG